MATTTPNRGYQLPAAGSKLKDDVLHLIAALGAIDVDVAAILLAMADKSNLGHGHGMDAISGLAAALGSKLNVGHHDALSDLTDVDVAGVANGMALLRQASKWIPVALQINNIAGLETALNGKATSADITAAINALVAAAPGTLDTLNELATALGNDPSFATTVSTALGLRVVKTELPANVATAINAATAKALPVDADALGFWDSVSSGFRKLTFVNLRGWAMQFFVRHDSAQALTAPQKAQALANLGISTFMQGALDEIDGLALFNALGGARSTGVSGYTRLPNGIILQWGQGSVSSGTVSYPTAFPTAVFSVVACTRANGTRMPAVDDFSQNNFSIRMYSDLSGNTSAAGFSWIAVGY